MVWHTGVIKKWKEVMIEVSTWNWWKPTMNQEFYLDNVF